ncbi:MAG TPA: dihydrodipicolinate synthase family protein [Candidatus Brocadiia bacterium]|nr:dihydrodipicolinate synthase family protein [Candidatus Brocadiia bacterium]
MNKELCALECDPRPLRRLFKGIFALGLTPMNQDKSIDWDALPRVLDYYCEQGFNGLFFPCGTSEYKRLEDDEIIALSRFATRHLAGRIPVVSACTPADSLEKNIELVKRMWDEARPDCCVVTLPHFLPDDDAAMIEYHQKIHDAANAPLMVYEIPGGAGYKFSPKAIATLAGMPRYYGYKDTTCNLPVAIEKIKACRGRMSVFQARVCDVWPSFNAGALGVMAIETNPAPKIFIRLWKAFQNGEESVGQAIHEWICKHDREISRGLNVSAKILFAERGVPIKPYSRNTDSLPSHDEMARMREAVADGDRLLAELG